MTGNKPRLKLATAVQFNFPHNNHKDHYMVFPALLKFASRFHNDN